MNDIVYQGYLLAFWPIMALLGLKAIIRWELPMLRCLAVIIFGQWAIDFWVAALAPGVWPGQPWHIYLTIYTASAFLVTIRPAGKLCSALGGVFIAGVIISVLRALFVSSDALDWLFWQSNLIIGWLALFVVIGGAGYEGGRRVLAATGRGLARMVDASHRSGVVG